MPHNNIQIAWQTQICALGLNISLTSIQMKRLHTFTSYATKSFRASTMYLTFMLILHRAFTAARLCQQRLRYS